MTAPTAEDLANYGVYLILVEKDDGSVHVYVGSGTADSEGRGVGPGIRRRLFRYEKGLRTARAGYFAYRFDTHMAADILADDTKHVHLRVLMSCPRTPENKQFTLRTEAVFVDYIRAISNQTHRQADHASVPTSRGDRSTANAKRPRRRRTGICL